MMAYNSGQLDRYLQHINFPRHQHPSQTLQLLTQLQARHVSRVPFENSALHYSRHRLLSLDPDDLYQKIVVDGKGGYCMELNAFFAAVLRGLGFELISGGARVKEGERFNGWDHMINLVDIEGQRYLVDVGFGANEPMHPVPLESGHEFAIVAPQRGKLEYRGLSQHSDPRQRLWVYSTRAPDDGVGWRERYCFAEIEFFPEDFAVMNMGPMTQPTSHFVQVVLAMRAVLNEDTGEVEGVVTLHKDQVKRRYRGDSEVLLTLTNEEQRVKALEEHFGIVLQPRERDAIKGLVSELRES